MDKSELGENYLSVEKECIICCNKKEVIFFPTYCKIPQHVQVCSVCWTQLVLNTLEEIEDPDFVKCPLCRQKIKAKDIILDFKPDFQNEMINNQAWTNSIAAAAGFNDQHEGVSLDSDVPANLLCETIHEDSNNILTPARAPQAMSQEQFNEEWNEVNGILQKVTIDMLELETLMIEQLYI